MLRQTIGQAGAFIVSFALVLGLNRHQISRPNVIDAVLARRYEESRTFDIVLAGDSRVMNGISGRVLSEVVGTSRIKNAGFAGAAFSQTYLDFVRRLIDPNGKRVMVLAINGRNLTRREVIIDGFLNTHARAASDRWNLAQIPLWMCHPFRHDNDPLRHYTFEADGTVLVTTPNRFPNEADEDYRTDFKTHPFQPALLDQLAANISKWRREGLRVICLRMSTSPSMAKIERENGGFDVERVRQAVTRAGAEWMPTPETTTETYDGSHLVAAEAVRFSRELGDFIRGGTTR